MAKKPKEYDLLYLDDLAKVLFCPLEALTVLAEEIKDRALAEIAGKGDLKEEIFNLKMLYESGMLNEDEYKKRVEKLIAELETVKEHNKKAK
ncbi:MAG: gas vesicle protein GvpG [Bacteroidales bacterium]|nr:gas vesicle protein GvpG [Bacteroidales bacterium]